MSGVRVGAVSQPFGRLNAQGTSLLLWTSSGTSDTSGALSLAIYANSIDILSSTRNAGATIRCVRNDCTAISSVTVSPGSATLSIADSVTLTANVSPIDPTNADAYEWQRSFNGVEWFTVPDATANTLNAPAVIVGITYYRVIVTRCGTPTTSANTAELTGYGAEPLSIIPVYVGAFWQNSRIGERLIRITRPTTGTIDRADGAWTATVVDGTGWIRLDTYQHDGSANLWQLTDPAIDGNDPYFDVSPRLVGGNAISVSGVMNASTPQIYFRIGLTGTQPVGSTPRYGMVLITYKDHRYSQRIFIRQGEEADFVMRQGDPMIYNGSVGGAFPENRARALRFSPYNLSVPLGYVDPNSVITNASPVYSAGLPLNGGVFTEYPSQAGYMFFYNYNRQAFAPHSTYAISGIGGLSSSLSLWNPAQTETCPPGYRRPKNNPNNTTTLDPDWFPANSELIQSLTQFYLTPDYGTFWDNTVVGYYADGFFDRRQIVTSADGVDYSAVSIGNNKVAFRGRLMFNPFNNAAIFLPFTGFIPATPGGVFTNRGGGADYWTSSIHALGARVIYILPNLYNVNMRDARQLGPVRCVKDIQTIGELGSTAPRIYVDTNGGDPKLMLTQSPTNNGAFFYYGGIVGWNYNNSGSANYNPTHNGGLSTWNISYSYNTSPVDHNVASLRAGNGDPCRLVGFTQQEVRDAISTSNASPYAPDNGLWRLPTGNEIGSVNITTGWTTNGGIRGHDFNISPFGTAFHPANGCLYQGAGNWIQDGNFPLGVGYYWSRDRSGGPVNNPSQGYAVALRLSQYGAVVNSEPQNSLFGIRCVQQ
jgi:hypothetical protein